MRRQRSYDIQSKPKLIFSQRPKQFTWISLKEARMRQFMIASNKPNGFKWFHLAHVTAFCFFFSNFSLIGKLRNKSCQSINFWCVLWFSWLIRMHLSPVHLPQLILFFPLKRLPYMQSSPPTHPPPHTPSNPQIYRKSVWAYLCLFSPHRQHHEWLR